MAMKPVIIIGAGVVGLTLAHGLKKAGIPFEVYERDESVTSRTQGWAITIHWALPYLKKMIEPEVIEAIEGVQVDPAQGRKDTGNFVFLNLETCESKFRIPPSERRRVNREKLRKVLLETVKDNVKWGKRLSSIDYEDSKPGVSVSFADGTTVNGSLVVGAEGSNSPTRKFLRPDDYYNRQLPIRFVGASVDMTYDEVKPLREVDPLLFQGSHPDSGCFMWVSMIEVPEINGTAGTDHERYRIQVMLSWPVKGPEDEVKPTDAERVKDMKRRAAIFAPVFKNAVNAIKDDAPVLEIKLADWPCLDWDNRHGKITLVGDAAHAMTMYRGEAANHGMLDAFCLYEALKTVQSGEKTQEQAINDFETEMRERTSFAVEMSRQACFDAHDFHGLNENSAVLRKRAVVAK